MRQFRILELWGSGFRDSFAFLSPGEPDFATVSQFRDLGAGFCDNLILTFFGPAKTDAVYLTVLGCGDTFF